MNMRNKISAKVLTMFLAIIMIFGILPLSAFAAPAADIPAAMLDNPILRALEYTGYNVQKQKDNGTIYQSGYYGSRLLTNAPDILTAIPYSTDLSGKETVTDNSSKTGLAPDISKFERNGLCCASFVTYFLCNYLPNIEGSDTGFILDAINAVGTNSQAVSTWRSALESLTAQGSVEKVGTSADNADYARLVPGDLIIFGNSSKSNVHIAVYAGAYADRHFIIHMANDHGPEISTVEGMGHSSNGDKASYPNAFYHLPDELYMQRGSIEIYKADETGQELSGAVFTATNVDNSSLVYRIGPTNSSGYASSGKVIPFGTYKIIETVFPANYQAFDKSEWTVTLDKNTPNGTVSIHAVNKLIPGSAKIVKTSEDGKVDGVNFRIAGNGIDQTVQTKNGGQIQIDNLTPGIYTVTELTEEKYEPQETRSVTVVSGQTATVTFNNTLKRGELTVTKTAEDGLTEGAKFHLYGVSLSGLAVDEYAVVESDGKAYFKDVLIGSDYTLEEVDTDVRYVVPEKQTADIEWNIVTNKSFYNALKKWRLSVKKIDSEQKTAQGDASLAGAKFGIYHEEELIDVYETDENGMFTTEYYLCGKRWSVREISASEGYLVNVKNYPIGAEPELYTVEYNEALTIYVPETVQKGKIAVIKHCDDGETQIETPETGAEFEVYLKRSGSYEAAKESERDILVCDEFGFAESKDLPYGIYTVRQTKGWEGKELHSSFDVFINENGEIYRYIINNAVIKSRVEIVKKDIETGKILPAAGIGFKVRNTDTGEYVVQHINYPTPVDIDIYYTDSAGKLMMPEALPYGNYEIIEQNTCYGYVLDSKPVSFTVDGSKKTVTVEKYNMSQKGRITVNKSGEIFSSVIHSNGIYQPAYSLKGLAGAVYEVIAAEDIYTLDGTLRYAKGAVVAEIKTDRFGKAVTEPLYLGEFEIREKTAPYGMIVSDEVRHVELTYAGQEVEITETETAFYNERQKATVNLSKVLAQDDRFRIGMNGEILSVQFGLFAAENLTAADGSVIPADGLLEIVSCDENGNVMFRTDIPVDAKLYVKELAVDAHYILSDKKYPVEFIYAGQNTAEVEIETNNGNPIKNDLIYGTIIGFKTDRITGETVAGALFGLFGADTAELTVGNAILTAESDKNGIFIFENVPYGNWLIKELKPADGFLSNDKIYLVSVTAKEETVEIYVVNDRIPELATQATTEGKKEITASDRIVIEDIVSYTNLIPGREYTFKGVLMDKATGKPLLINGEEIRSSFTFKPEAPDGEVTLTFVFDASELKTITEIVVFECLYYDGAEIVAHADIEDDGQTVKIVPLVPEIPPTGDNANIGFWIGLAAVAAGALVSASILYIRQKKDNDDE